MDRETDAPLVTAATRDALLALADRVEAATVGNWRLSVEVEIAVLGYPERAYERRYASWPSDRMEFARQWLGSRFTASLDAAMTLVPEGWYGRIEPRFYSDDGDVRWRAYCLRPDWSVWTPHDDWVESVGPVPAATPALALTAAALRARAAMMGEGSATTDVGGHDGRD